MRHPTDEQLYDLAQKISADADLSQEEKKQMRHIADCDDCYHMICCLLAMQDVATHIGEFANVVSPRDIWMPIQESFSAVIRLVVKAVNSALDPLESGTNGWAFRRVPAALAGARSIGNRTASAVRKLTDSHNSQTFVAYDPDKMVLVIQIDSADCEVEPHASILLPGGERIEVSFEKREHLFWAEVQGLQEGEYKILLEK